MKKRDLYAFRSGLKMSKFEHPRLTYAVSKNKRQVDQIIADMEKAIELDEDMGKFTKEREELAKKHCKKDEKGNPVLRRVPDIQNPGEVQTIYDIPGQDDEKSPYRKDLAKLEKKFEGSIKKHEEKVRKYNEEFLDDETEFEPHKVDLELMEPERCPQAVMDKIYWMIKE